MGMTLRIELFPADLDVFFDFYTRVLRFEVERDERTVPWPYVSVQRDSVHIGAVRAWEEVHVGRLPPFGTEIVLEVDDVQLERDAIVAEGGELLEDLVDRPWGLRDFRLLDPDGHLLRYTSR
jgi:predicted enzyme related to lactoylglutathione lyase